MLWLRSLLVLILLSPLLSVSAGELAVPEGPVILTVEGAIEHTNGGGGARFDRTMLEDLQQQLVRTRTPWTDGVNDFEGPLGRALLEAVGARGDTLLITALNDYRATVPVADLWAHDVILALKMNTEYMRIRDKGPLFLVYPFDSDPALRTEVIQNRSVWQIKHILVK